MTPRRLCCLQQQFKTTRRRDVPTVQQQFKTKRRKRLDRASQSGPVRAITEHSNRLRSATKLDDINQIAPRAAKRLERRSTAPQPGPKSLAITVHSNCQLDATNRLDDTNLNGHQKHLTTLGVMSQQNHDYILLRHASHELLSSRQTLLREQKSQQDQVYIIQNANQELSSSCQTLLRERMSQQTTTTSFKDMQIKSF